MAGVGGWRIGSTDPLTRYPTDPLDPVLERRPLVAVLAAADGADGGDHAPSAGEARVGEGDDQRVGGRGRRRGAQSEGRLHLVAAGIECAGRHERRRRRAADAGEAMDDEGGGAVPGPEEREELVEMVL